MSEDLQAELDRLKAENEKLKTESKKKTNTGVLSFKVSAKGAVSVYGMGRFPVTLYKEQWTRLFERIDDLKEFLTENEDQLTTK